MRIPTIVKCDWEALKFETKRYIKQNFEEPYVVAITNFDSNSDDTERAVISLTNGDKHKTYFAYFTGGKLTVVYAKNDEQKESHIEQIWELCDVLVNNLE